MLYQRAEHPLKLDGLAAARTFFSVCLTESDSARESMWMAHVDSQARCLHVTCHEGDETGALPDPRNHRRRRKARQRRDPPRPQSSERRRPPERVRSARDAAPGVGGRSARLHSDRPSDLRRRRVHELSADRSALGLAGLDLLRRWARSDDAERRKISVATGQHRKSHRL